MVAVAALTYMTFWMKQHARGFSTELQRRSDLALSSGSRWGLGILSFQAVGREGLETMVFTLAIVFASERQAATPVHGRWLLLGAVVGLAAALVVAFFIYRLGHRLNLGRFFLVLGVVLMVFAAGLLADAVENLQQLGWLPIWQHVLWNTSRTLSEESSIGDVLHSLFGYADEPTALQLLAWVSYLAVAATLFVRRPRRRAVAGSTESST
jgi:high-affinity iron transporter